MKTFFSIAILVPLGLTLASNQFNSPFDDEPTPIAVQLLNERLRAPPAQETSHRANIETRWIEQPLDNFDDQNTNTWQQRILINDEYFQEGGPILIYNGGEWKIDPSSITAGLLVDIAAEHGGTLVYTEHRFFGDSIPIKPLSTENLKYHSVEQAMADLAHVINELKSSEERYANSKVVISGCSYSATMTVLFRQIYGNLTVGGWASSAPLEAQVDFKGYMKVVGKAYKELGSQQCYDRIKNGIASFEEWYANGENDRVKAYLQLCDNFDPNNERDRQALFSSIANTFAGVAQYQQPGELSKFCGYLDYWSKTDDGDDDALGVANFFYWRLNRPKCVNTRYQGTVDYYKWSQKHYDGSSGVAWTYQTCKEFGWFQSSASSKQPFGSSFPATYYTDICKDVFGDDFTADKIEEYIQDTNDKYGGINAGTADTYQTHGGLDPWHVVGAGEAEGAVILPKSSHCSDLGSISDNDSAEQKASKEKIIELVREWLAQ